MSENSQSKIYQRKITPIERLFTRSPFSVVTMVTRIKGEVTESLLREAIHKAQQRHPNLRVRIREGNDHIPWFTSEGVQDIPVVVVPRKSQDDWIHIYAEAAKVPFDFEKRPAIRFFLVHSPEISELIILCHHIICDGLSLAFLARDLMTLLGDPDRDPPPLPDPQPISLDNLPDGVSQNGLVKYFIERINRQWDGEKIHFDQEDYYSLCEAYWNNFHHEILSIELDEYQTSRIVDRCREMGVTVNSALAAAFVGAQTIIQGDLLNQPTLGSAASVRDRLNNPETDIMGFYAGVVILKFRYDQSKNFWENALRLHKKLNPLYTNKNLFKDFLSWLYLRPAILESINFKKLGGLVPADSPRHEKISGFSKKNDVVLSILKRDKMESLDRKILGTAVTNLGRLDFPVRYGELELERLILQPGGAFPLVNVNLVLGAVTCSGKLSLVVEFAEEAVGSGIMEKVKHKALELLLAE